MNIESKINIVGFSFIFIFSSLGDYINVKCAKVDFSEFIKLRDKLWLKKKIRNHWNTFKCSSYQQFSRPTLRNYANYIMKWSRIFLFWTTWIYIFFLYLTGHSTQTDIEWGNVKHPFYTYFKKLPEHSSHSHTRIITSSRNLAP